MERNFLNLTNIMINPTANIILVQKRFFLTETRNKGCTAPTTTLFQDCTGSPRYMKQERRNKLKSIWIRNETNLSFFMDKKTVDGENIKELTKKLLELISNYSKVAGYKVISQKLNPSLFTSNKQMEFEIKNTMLTLALKK